MVMVTARKMTVLGSLMVLFVAYGIAGELKVGDAVKGEEAELLVDLLGTNAAVVVTDGCVFVDGDYLPAPYRIQRIGQGVVVNGMLVNWIYKGTLPRTNEISAAKTAPSDPEVPNDIRESSHINLSPLSMYLINKYNYLHWRFGKEGARKKIFDVIRALPCVESVEPKPGFPGTLTVRHKDGFVTGWVAAPFDLSSINRGLGPEHLRGAAEAEIQSLKQQMSLPQGQALFVSSVVTNRPWRIPIVAEWLARDFDAAMKEVFSHVPEAQKVLALRKLRLQGIDSDESAAKFIDNCLKSDALRQRLGKAAGQGTAVHDEVPVNP